MRRGAGPAALAASRGRPPRSVRSAARPALSGAAPPRVAAGRGAGGAGRGRGRAARSPELQPRLAAVAAGKVRRDTFRRGAILPIRGPDAPPFASPCPAVSLHGFPSARGRPTRSLPLEACPLHPEHWGQCNS